MNTEYLNDRPEALMDTLTEYGGFYPVMVVTNNTLTYRGEDCDYQEVAGEHPLVTLFSTGDDCVGFRIDSFEQFCAESGMSQADMIKELKEFYGLEG